jgi:hypothetical protein
MILNIKKNLFKFYLRLIINLNIELNVFDKKFKHLIVILDFKIL